jgi:hypothetical protein
MEKKIPKEEKRWYISKLQGKRAIDRKVLLDLRLLAPEQV